MVYGYNPFLDAFQFPLITNIISDSCTTSTQSTPLRLLSVHIHPYIINIILIPADLDSPHNYRYIYMNVVDQTFRRVYYSILHIPFHDFSRIILTYNFDIIFFSFKYLISFNDVTVCDPLYTNPLFLLPACCLQ